MLAAACLLAAPDAGAAAAAAGARPAPAGTPGVGTATEYRAGAPIVATLTGAITISPLRASLRSDPSVPVPGQRVTVTLTVSNTGALPVTALRPVLEFLSGSSFCGAAAGPVPAAVSQVAPGGVALFTWTVSVTAPGPIRARAVLTATVTGQGGVAGAVERDLSPPALARLSASLDPERLPVQAGRWFTVTVTVSNTGGVKAAGIMPALQPVDGVKLVTRVAGPEPAKPLRLTPGESARFSFSYSANGSGRVVFSATVSAQADLSPPGLLSRAGATAGELAAEGAAWSAGKARELKARAAQLLFPPKPPPPGEPPLTSFESPGEDRWETDGYATLALSATRATDGASSALATFMVPGDLTVTGTGEFRPTLRLRSLPRGRETALRVRDWSGYLAFKADAYAEAPQPLRLTLALVDQRGYRWEEARQVPPGSATTLAFDLAGPREARLDLSRLSALELGVDTTGLKTRPRVWLDHLRFVAPVLPPAGLSSTAAGTATRTGTGRAGP